MAMTAKTVRGVAALKSKRDGKRLEKATLAFMREMGYQAWPIATPSSILAGKRVYTERVPADIFGISKRGEAVLVECKHRMGAQSQPRRPVPSDFEPHQIAALLEWEKRGGHAMIAWFCLGVVVWWPASQILKETTK